MSEPMLRLRVDLDIKVDDPYERAGALSVLRSEIISLDPTQVQFITDDNVPWQRDPLIYGALLIAITPRIVSKLLDVLVDFMRRNRNKGITIELSVRSEEGIWIKLKAPYTSSPEDMVAWIKEVQTRLGGGSQGEGQNRNGG